MSAWKGVGLVVVALIGGCVDPASTYVEIPLHGAGTAGAPFEVRGWTVELERAEVGIGPLWLCATEMASSEFCSVAVLEVTETITIDARADAPVQLAMLRGVPGTVRSMMFDYGITWLATESSPRPSPGAPGGHSARFAGRATHEDGRTFAFEADVDLEPMMAGDPRVRGRRVDAHEVTGSDDALIVRCDARAWWSEVDLDALAARGEETVVIAPGDEAYGALVVAMTATQLPTLEWGRE